MPRLTFGYSDSEDRVWLASSDGDRYWLTRRLIHRFIGPAAQLLERTVAGGEVPNALPACRRVAIEHAEALADTPAGEPALAHNVETRSPTDPPPAPPQLVNTLRLDATPTGCRLTLVAVDRENVLDLGRRDCHRLLGTLALTACDADWGIELPGWLHADTDG